MGIGLKRGVLPSEKGRVIEHGRPVADNRTSDVGAEKGGAAMGSEGAERGRGLFGYRRAVVQQIISDRDVMLRQAEGRVRAAESRVSELEQELNSMRDRGTRMEEQLERLRALVENRGTNASMAQAPPEPVETVVDAGGDEYPAPSWEPPEQSASGPKDRYGFEPEPA